VVLGEAITGVTLGFIGVSRVDNCGLSERDCAAAIGMGVGREIEVCVAIAVVILLINCGWRVNDGMDALLLVYGANRTMFHAPREPVRCRCAQAPCP
jgi:hypothetical protein